MKINNLRIQKLEIPFKYTFKHASAERHKTQSLWIELFTENNIIGYGESCPREYVTEESVHSAEQFIAQIKTQLCQTEWDMDTLKGWTKHNKQMIDRNPAAWCETAVKSWS